jgi:phosphoribosylformylglycinamidine synthase subunit PurS
MFKARIHVTLRPSILDPQGKATREALRQLGHAQIEDVRMGKYVEVTILEQDEAAARAVAEEACRKLLANPVTENYHVELEALQSA